MTGLRHLLADRRGVAALEAALGIMMLTLLTAAAVDLGRYLHTNLKVQNVAETVANLVTREEELTRAEFNQFFAPVGHVAAPLDFPTFGVVIVSGVSIDVNDLDRVRWQQSGGGARSERSRIGTPGSAPKWPVNGFQLQVGSGRSVITAEAFYHYEPLFNFMMEPRTIYAAAIMRPRVGSLDRLD
ncbi:MAG: pilus assembly protein [Alphaproteobacteria bacterium]|nr:pilus assembly protein [Alphaproteobacteria bacterium]